MSTISGSFSHLRCAAAITVAASLLAGTAQAQVCIPLPCKQLVSIADTLLSITNSSSGRVGHFWLKNTTSANPAVTVRHEGAGNALSVVNAGTGQAGNFSSSSATNLSTVLTAWQAGSGQALSATITNSANSKEALYGTSSGSGIAVRGLMSGANGRAGSFEIGSAANAKNALEATTAGSGNAFRAFTAGAGKAGLFDVTSASSVAPALEANHSGPGSAVHGVALGTGMAGQFEVRSSGNNNAAVDARSSGTGYAVYAGATGLGTGGILTQTSDTTSWGHALDAKAVGYGSAAVVQNTSYGNSVPALEVFNNGRGTAITATTYNSLTFEPGVKFTNYSNNGATAHFYALADSYPNAIRVTDRWSTHAPATPGSKPALLDVAAANGEPGLRIACTGASPAAVIHADDNAVALAIIGGDIGPIVKTLRGATAVYNESSTEVWFSDYGSGQTVSGTAIVTLDSQFRETVNTSVAYHVFLQAHGPSVVYDAARGPSSFTVKVRPGDPDCSFSYRVVAKRAGHESRRLRAIPSLDAEIVQAASATRRTTQRR